MADNPTTARSPALSASRIIQGLWAGLWWAIAIAAVLQLVGTLLQLG